MQEFCFNSNEATQKRASRVHNVQNFDLFEQQETVLADWQGQPKGLLQVLWERGLINESLEKFTLVGQKDPITGKVDLQLSL